MSDAVSFRPEVFWHAPSNGIMLWNAKLQNGWIYSISLIAENQADDGFTTPYEALHKDREKEATWEKVRREEFVDLPSRMKALFLFVSREDAELANATWWKGENRPLIQVLVPVTSKVHVADSKHLNALSHEWEQNARRYWNGEMTAAPHVEAVLHGAAWIPNIDQFKISL